MTDWSGDDYAEISGLQRAMITDAMAGLVFSPRRVGSRHRLRRRISHRAPSPDMVPDGYAVGADASHRMIATASLSRHVGNLGPSVRRGRRAQAPVRRVLRCGRVVQCACTGYRSRPRRLQQIAASLRPGGRATVQMVCAGPRASLESVMMDTSQNPSWASRFVGFTAPFVHVDPDYLRCAGGIGGSDAGERHRHRPRMGLRFARGVPALVRGRLDGLDRQAAGSRPRQVRHRSGRRL